MWVAVSGWGAGLCWVWCPTATSTCPSNPPARLRGLLDLLDASRLRDRSPALMAAAEGFLQYAGAER